MSLLKKVLKRAARNVVLKAATTVGRSMLSGATGGLSEKAISVGKSIGAKVHGNRLAKKQGKAVSAALKKLENAPAPGLQDNTRVMRPGTAGSMGRPDWISQATSGVLESSVQPSGRRKRRKRGSAGTDSGTSTGGVTAPVKRKTPARKTVGPSDAVKASKKAAAESKKAEKARAKGPRKAMSAATKKKFQNNADKIAAKGDKWRTMTPAEQKKAGGWRKFAFGT